MIIALYAVLTVAVIVLWLPPVTRKLIAFEDGIFEKVREKLGRSEHDTDEA